MSRRSGSDGCNNACKIFRISGKNTQGVLYERSAFALRGKFNGFREEKIIMGKYEKLCQSFMAQLQKEASKGKKMICCILKDDSLCGYSFNGYNIFVVPAEITPEFECFRNYPHEWRGEFVELHKAEEIVSGKRSLVRLETPAGKPVHLDSSLMKYYEKYGVCVHYKIPQPNSTDKRRVRKSPVYLFNEDDILIGVIMPVLVW